MKSAAVGIDGADSNGKANDKEMRGDAAAVAQRRGAALRKRYDLRVEGGRAGGDRGTHSVGQFKIPY